MKLRALLVAVATVTLLLVAYELESATFLLAALIILLGGLATARGEA